MSGALFRRRLKPIRLPNPLPDAHSESFFPGFWLGVVLTIAIAVIVFQGAR